MTNTYVYFRTINASSLNFEGLRAPTLEELHAIVLNKLQEIKDHVSMKEENKQYWTDYYNSLRYVKVTETVEIVA